MIKVLNCITGQHSIALVLLAAAVCAFGSFTALSLLARARDKKTSEIDGRWLVARLGGRRRRGVEHAFRRDAGVRSVFSAAWL